MEKQMKKSENNQLDNSKREPMRDRDSGYKDAVPGINTPGIELPAFNPPVPNRAWTAMRNGMDIDNLTEEEKRDLYLGADDIF